MYNALKTEIALIEVVPIKTITLDGLEVNNCTPFFQRKDGKYSTFRNFLLLRTNTKNKKQSFKSKTSNQFLQSSSVRTLTKRPMTGVTCKTQASNGTERVRKMFNSTSKQQQETLKRVESYSPKKFFKQQVILKNYFPQRKSTKLKSFKWQKHYLYAKKNASQQITCPQKKEQPEQKRETNTCPTPIRYLFPLRRKNTILNHKRSESIEQVCPWTVSQPQIVIANPQINMSQFFLK